MIVVLLRLVSTTCIYTCICYVILYTFITSCRSLQGLKKTKTSCHVNRDRSSTMKKIMNNEFQ